MRCECVRVRAHMCCRDRLEPFRRLTTPHAHPKLQKQRHAARPDERHDASLMLSNHKTASDTMRLSCFQITQTAGDTLHGQKSKTASETLHGQNSKTANRATSSGPSLELQGLPSPPLLTVVVPSPSKESLQKLRRTQKGTLALRRRCQQASASCSQSAHSERWGWHGLANPVGPRVRPGEGTAPLALYHAPGLMQLTLGKAY